MTGSLDIRIFAHSWVSDWNHGNAHFLRGLARSLGEMGHRVRCYEQWGSWSLTNLVQNEGERAIDSIDQFRAMYPTLDVRFYQPGPDFAQYAAEELKGADVVIIHEWNDPQVANAILSLKQKLGFYALFHDTHHRAYTSAREILRFQLHLFDGVLAFGEAIRRIYADGFGVPHAWTLHEAADVNIFYPRVAERDIDLVWIGNWGDEERTRELEEFLVGPASAIKPRRTLVYGVRYPETALERLKEAGIEFCGYLPNLRAPEVYGRTAMTLHVPRRQYTNGLSGIPTIRVFEAMACGAPLLCSPWIDTEGLFRPGDDYLTVADGESMTAEIQHLLRDDKARQQLAQSGLATVRNRHTCKHRAEQLVEICEELAR
ncbi:MAG: glycosyltransferase [Acidobacteriaceae bacterium]|nr:glycosyltransferase [Acidobacteriaceae bacterium]